MSPVAQLESSNTKIDALGTSQTPTEIAELSQFVHQIDTKLAKHSGQRD